MSDRLQLEDQPSIDDEIETLAQYPVALVGHVDRVLLVKGNSAQCQLDTGCAPVGAFEVARAEVPMHLDEATDDPID